MMRVLMNEKISFSLLTFIPAEEKIMQVKIKKWENSFAVQIPKTYALETQLKSDSFVNMWLSNGKIIIEPCLTTKPLTLDKLLAGVTDENLHGEIKTGNVVGKEVW
jgi:antitoxin MazE